MEIGRPIALSVNSHFFNIEFLPTKTETAPRFIVTVLIILLRIFAMTMREIERSIAWKTEDHAGSIGECCCREEFFGNCFLFCCNNTFVENTFHGVIDKINFIEVL